MQGAHSSDLSGFSAVPARRRSAARRLARHQVGVGAVAVAVAVALAGCTAEAEEPVPSPPVTTVEPTATTTTEAEPEPEPAPSPNGLVRPEAMDRNDDAGAIAAAEYYTLLAYEALRISDTNEWETVGAETCVFCSDLTMEVKTGIEEGAQFEGGEVELLGPGSIVGRDDVLGVIGVDVPVRVHEQTKIDSNGNLEQTWPVSDHFLYIELAHGYEGWVVMEARSHAAAF